MIQSFVYSELHEQCGHNQRLHCYLNITHIPKQLLSITRYNCKLIENSIKLKRFS